MRGTPELAVYLPLSITVYEAEGITRFLAMSPLELAAGDAGPSLLATLKGWDADVRDMFSRLDR